MHVHPQALEMYLYTQMDLEIKVKIMSYGTAHQPETGCCCCFFACCFSCLCPFVFSAYCYVKSTDLELYIVADE